METLGFSILYNSKLRHCWIRIEHFIQRSYADSNINNSQSHNFFAWFTNIHSSRDFLFFIFIQILVSRRLRRTQYSSIGWWINDKHTKLYTSRNAIQKKPHKHTRWAKNVFTKAVYTVIADNKGYSDSTHNTIPS